MSSRRYQLILNRQQEMLLPPCVDEYVNQNNPVRAIDAYVDTLDLQTLEFKNTQPGIAAGQPAYNPAALLKLYLYGYFQGIRSSRKLEREASRNLEVIWLIEGLRPTYKTIADFRKVNGVALKAANRDFLLLCKELAKDSGDKQVSTFDKDARLLTKRGQTVAGYNVQIVVDDKHKLIVAEEVTQDGNDFHQLAPMLAKAQAILQSENLTELADSGYYEGNQLKTCEDQSIEVYVAIPDKSKVNAEKGRFTREQFNYDSEQDCYTCPQWNLLIASGNPHQKNGKQLTCYKSKATSCSQCLLREQCLGEKATIKKIQRWEHEAVIDRHKQRMEQKPGIMKKRGALAEHPFGTLKHRAGINHFLMRGLEKCSGEFSLMVLGYNFTRVLNILGVDALRDYCARRPGNTLRNVGYA
ncbi:transposase [Methylobacter psychrophilus]|uniref:transposase n=1 Tax=Methylobacter psychrophilus TaxID=96941 RepID=UPI0021D4BFE1|nr:transposase [Methylobacter psychrophilus]